MHCNCTRTGFEVHTCLRATNFVDFEDFHDICFTKNQQKFYHGTDCRLKRRHQCRLMKIVSLNFSLTKFVALQKRRPTVWTIQTGNCFKVARNYSYVASTTAINNAAASQLPAKKRLATGLQRFYHLFPQLILLNLNKRTALCSIRAAFRLASQQLFRNSSFFLGYVTRVYNIVAPCA